MALEAALWCAVAMTAPFVARRCWPVILARIGDRARPLVELGPWLHGALPAYLALISGAILGRDAGLYGQSLGQWMASVLGVGIALALVHVWLRRRALDLELPKIAEAALDEPRWALYRASGVLWTGMGWAGILVGIGLMAGEWAMTQELWRQPPEAGKWGWLWLIRGMASSLYFGVTGNLWLTAALQLGILFLASRARSGDGRPQLRP